MLKVIKGFIEAMLEARRRRIELMLRNGMYHGWY